MERYKEILNLIKVIRESFPNAVEVYTKGSCVRFALILKTIYPDGDIYWNEDHAIFKLDNHFYDITGEVASDGHTNLEEWGILHINKVLQLRYNEPEMLC